MTFYSSANISYLYFEIVICFAAIETTAGQAETVPEEDQCSDGKR